MSNTGPNVRSKRVPPTHATPRIVSRLYREAAQPLRARMLRCLLEPMTSLSLVGVAAGAFSMFLTHRPRPDDACDLEAASRFTPEQIAELTAFVEQIDPRAVSEVATLVADHAVGLASFTATTAVLLRDEAQRRKNLM
jgi:hypothetical protein